MVEQLSQRHVRPGVGEVGKAFADRVVEREHSVVDERERGGTAERLGHAGDTHVVIGRRRVIGADLGDPNPEHVPIRTRLHDGDRAGWPARHRNQFSQRQLELRPPIDALT